MLGWTREELADASGISRGTIHNLEQGILSPRGKTLELLCKAIEGAGFEFTENEGVRRLRPDLKVIQGADSRQAFFEFLLQNAKRNKGEILAVFDDPELLLRTFGMDKKSSWQALQKLLLFADMRCLFARSHERVAVLENCTARLTSNTYLSEGSHFIYNNSHIILRAKSGEHFTFVIFSDLDLALQCKNKFNLIWELAVPFIQPQPRATEQQIRA
ncbi:MAG: helix-turn-helix transcriptional regulator [Alphaproteobacteria bacterium]|nr:helix-turn-helix transcriptional regulator [Alphaproteobacteria bacterium]